MKKCIVLDLDNTLWGGVIGEDGMEGIALSLTQPGASFLAFQQALRDLHDRGIILAVNSRNNPDDALRVIREHPNMLLKEPHFAAMRINWEDKAQNIRELAQELNIGFDSMVFLDDDPVNRAVVRARVPEVEVPELPVRPEEYVKFLHSLPYFETNTITDEDKMRGNLYVTERLRKEAEKQFTDRESYLRSLGMEVHVHEDDPSALARLAQLTEKTNQFNTNKQSRTEAELQDMMQDEQRGVYYARAVDQFGDHGIIAMAQIEKGEKNWHIDNLLMSCRVLMRGIEDAFIAAIAARARQAGVDTIDVVFVPTERNEPAKTFIDRMFGPERFLQVNDASIPDWISVQYHHENI